MNEFSFLGAPEWQPRTAEPERLKLLPGLPTIQQQTRRLRRVDGAAESKSMRHTNGEYAFHTIRAEYDRDPYVPGKPIYSPAEIDELRKKYESPSQQPGPHRPVADVINNDEPPVAKAEPVAAPRRR
jgi:hypothetical protein